MKKCLKNGGGAKHRPFLIGTLIPLLYSVGERISLGKWYQGMCFYIHNDQSLLYYLFALIFFISYLFVENWKPQTF